MSSQKVLISVIVPCYNAERYVDVCLSRLVDQTYRNLEIICVNDGSTDGTMEILEKWRGIDSRIQIIDKHNNGLPQARRTGFEASHGDYIAFLDCDDWFENNALEKMAAVLDTHGNMDVVSCDVVYEYEDVRKKPHVQSAQYGGGLTPEETLTAIYKRESVFQYAWNKLYRRSAICPDWFPYPSCMGEDYFTVIRFIRDGSLSTYHVMEPLHHYLQQPNSMCKGGYSEAHTQAFDLFLKEERDTAEKFPQLSRSVGVYTTVELLWLLLPMARNGNTDERVLGAARKRFRRWLFFILASGKIGITVKSAAVLAALSPNLLIGMYGRLYLHV